MSHENRIEDTFPDDDIDIDDDTTTSPPVTLATVALHRHGQGQHNVEGLQIMDPPLTARGVQEARDIGKRYQDGTLPIPHLDRKSVV